MRGCRFTCWCLMMVMAGMVASRAAGQGLIHPSAQMDNRLGPGYYQDEPLSSFDPGYFQHDLQFFAPAELSELDGGPEPPIGWFFSYSRVFMSSSGPFQTTDAQQGQDVNGNRFDMGLMTDANHGWLLEYLRISTSDRAWGELNSVDLSKSFRLGPFSHGDSVELFAGPRFTSYRDRTAPTFTSNRIVGGQVGLRWFLQSGHWKLSAEGRGFAGENFQSIAATSATEFVWGGDLRSEAALMLTRDFSLVAGWEMLAFGRGMGRANNILANDQHMILAGVTIGFQLNR